MRWELLLHKPQYMGFSAASHPSNVYYAGEFPKGSSPLNSLIHSVCFMSHWLVTLLSPLIPSPLVIFLYI